jgi:hypothetical protein
MPAEVVVAAVAVAVAVVVVVVGAEVTPISSACKRRRNDRRRFA